MLLAIDTSIGTSVAVVDRDRGVLAERATSDTRSHAEVIGAYIDECLGEAQVAASALSAVAIGMGPGPFTGLRVGIAAANAFAFGIGRPVVRVVSHDAVAFAELRAGRRDPVLVVSDARRREVYWSTYAAPDSEGLPKRVQGPALTRPDGLEDAVTRLDEYRRVDASEVSAGALGMLAETMHPHGREFAASEPLYLRSPDVTLAKAPKRVTG
ncbi:tRNA (adenosine(37)-N6)-threonylcarbamoyltransferase complex dimerization subunit type 1 TsaB [Ruicaihuangia caeni]|uniref:tRNA (Adenosine(37)-N6)-threonylcarbamoyltransferase complex dimerization subunit type 1 TsaB n=1 Tax=Ruicaihuangia caeni TaxID=3042517 RepID=A0AAW6T5V7_9MICO|nr:tRNA (adenosine(37)-N6)-threonylcarbamoyltransferase complex dimerization subunit type 1 TsaB [Klugiella sp. YN-L-19]MDI2098619.1 tRNA (adenosine(37)-N6)-threonylcarbamoyltransferase complex dimerization subunit type 1 TsaB [Klugiella sp. YN-L-19]